MTPFGVLLSRYIHSRGWTLTEAAERLDIDRGNLSKICKGVRTPPLKHLPHWSVTLRVPRAEVGEFQLMAELEHAPEMIRKRWWEQEARLVELEAELDHLRQQLERHGIGDRPSAKVADQAAGYGDSPPKSGAR